MSQFEVTEYIRAQEKEKQFTDIDENGVSQKGKKEFYEACDIVMMALSEIEREEGQGKESEILEMQKDAILGQVSAVAYYKNKIRDIIRSKGLASTWYPKWFYDLEDAFVNELIGFAGLAEWIEGRTESLAESSSAKIIGDRVYYMIGGKMVMQPQKIYLKRRRQLRNALLLMTPEKRVNAPYHEVYLLDGTRVTLYNEGLAKYRQDSIVFRKFFVKDHTFEEQAARGTIPKGSVPLFKSMVKVGFNVSFIGAVKTAKTTFLTTWQSYEDSSLEGVMVESDPEIPLHVIMPKAPILQFVPTDEDFPYVVKKIMRSDADYIVMAEARDGVALNTAVKAANKGTRRVKMTFHTTDPIEFCYDVADEINLSFGGNLGSTITKVAKSFHYLFQFIQLQDKSQKRLKAIWEIRYDIKTRRVTMHQILKYDMQKDSWSWKYDVGEDKEEIGYEENLEAFEDFKKILKELEKENPMEGDNSYVPAYDMFIRKGDK